MLTIKRLISALFVVFFVSYTNVALAVKCSDGYIAQQGDTSCQPCDWGEFCYAGESTATASGSTQRYKCDVQSGGPYYLYQQLNIDSYLVSSKSYSSGNTGCLIQMNGSFVFKNGSVVQCGEGKHAVTSDGSQCNIEVEYSSTLTKCTCVETERSVVAYFLNGNTNFWVQPTYGVNLSLNKTFLPSKGLVVPEKPWPTQNEDMTATYSVYENSTLYNAGPFSGTIPNDSMPDAGIYISANWNDGFPFEFKYSRDPSQYTTVGTYPSFDNTTVYNYEGTTSNFIMLQATTPCAQIYFEKPDLGDNYVFIGWGGATTSDDYFRLLYDSDGMPLNKCATVGNLSSSDSYYDGAQNGKISLVDRWWTRKYKIVENLNYDSATDTAKDTCSYSYRTWSNIPDYCLLSAPDERPGYTFSGWAVRAQKYMLKSDATNNASEYVTEDIVENGKMITIAQPGQSFFTWAGEITAETAPNGNNADYAKIIATAQWTPNTYTITFNPGTGDGVSAENVDFDGSLPQITPPARLGYKFLGYYDGETKYYDENGTAQFDAYTTPSDVTLTAQWTPNTYTITFNPENGGAATTETVTFDAQYPTAPSVAKTGYTFVGWFDSVTGGTQYYTDDGATYAVADDLKLYAQWTPNSFTIIYNGNGATGEMSPTTCTYDQSCFVADNAFTKTDYKFAGWQMTDGTPVAVGADFTNKTAVANGNIILVAQWSLDTLDCQLGKYYNGTDFVDCPAGQYCPGTGTVNVGMAGCGEACPAGYDDAAGAESQEDCAIYVPAGSYLATARDATPTDCPLGHHCPGDVIVNYGNTSEIYGCGVYGYADETGLAECKKCPDITKGALIEAAQNSRNDDGVRDSINDCAYAFMFAAPEYVDAWNMTPPDFYDTASPLNQRGFFTVICQYNSDTNDYDTNCYANFVGYCADGYYSPQSQEATTYGDAQNVMYENINLKTLENLPCQPVESGLGFVSPGIDTDAPTSDTNFKSLQQQCKPADNEIGAAMVMTDSRYGFGGSEKTCAAVYQFAFFPGGEKYAPKPNIRGSYVTRCLYNKNTGEYDGGCQTNVIYCDSGYYATVKLSPDSGDLTDKMILRTATVDDAVDRACAPVGDGYYSPGQMQCLIEQNINPEETFVVPEFNQETQQCFMDIQNLGVEYVSQRHVCPDGGLTDKETAYSIEQCFKSDVECSDDNGGTGVQKCYYDESAKKYSLDCTECEITQCPAGQYMDNGCVDCPVGQYCPGGTSKPVDCPEHSSTNGETGKENCTCNTGHSVGGDKTTITTTGAACVANTYTVIYRDEYGEEIIQKLVTFDTQYPEAPSVTKTGHTFVGWFDSVTGGTQYYTDDATYTVAGDLTLYAQWTPNKFNLIFQNGGADNADNVILPTGIVGTYDEPLPDISKFSPIELTLTDVLTDAGQRYMVSDGWKFNDYYKAWNKDGTSTGNCDIWSDNCLLPIEPDGETVYVSPYWVTDMLKCNPGYYMKSNVGRESCSPCPSDSACPGWNHPERVGKEFGRFACPKNSGPADTRDYCTCDTGYSANGKYDGEKNLTPDINTGFAGQECKYIYITYTYDPNGGEGYVQPNDCSYMGIEGGCEPIPAYAIGNQMYRAGYVFKGWGETRDAKTPYDYVDNPPTTDKTLYAIWEPCEEGTYKTSDMNLAAACTLCPETHPKTFKDASTSITQCYAECKAQIDMNWGVAFRDNETEPYGKECTYSRGKDKNENECVIVEDRCVHTDCKPEYEMINGRCEPCARKYALSYNPNGNCRVESCVYGYHPNGDKCEGDTIECDAPNAVAAERVWNSATNSFGACVITKCSPGYHVDANACVSDTRVCKIENGIGEESWDAKRNRWGDCVASRCEPGYTTDPDLTNERWKDCGRCNNMFGIDGDVAVSSYINDECEIATCMYQGEKYILEDNECRLICGDYTDETGYRYWDDKAHECKHECNPGYLQW